MVIAKDTIQYEITFTLSPQDYFNYNRIVYEENIYKKHRRQTVIGIVSVIVAALVLGTFLITSEFETMFVTLDILLILFGIYSLVYYPLLFPRLLKKAAMKKYREANMAYDKITLQFSEEAVIETIQGNNETVDAFFWSSFRQVFVYDNYTILMLKAPQGVYVPSRILDEEHDAKLKSFIIQMAEENELKVLYEK